ncbi:MAG: cysteine--tRNA ligase [Candidatus Nitrosocosmicus sp.]
MKLYNTLSNEIEEINFTDNILKIYLCGITVYDDCHIGHARTIIIFDVLRRLMLSKNIQVLFIQNFTDIDDKIIKRANADNTSFDAIAEKYIKSYFRDFDSLNVSRASFYPKATEHIKDIVEFIDKLIKKDKAYVGINGVYYKVRSFPFYGKLSKKISGSLEAGARIEIDETKDDPRDFALWKFSSKEPKWNTPWGTGRPGWHIECSTMAIKYLGNNFDIHGGGQDLIFPHHENEIAQSEGLTNICFAKMWLHIGMVTIKTEKMSKSLGNTIKISDLLKKINPNIIRLFCLSSHYSKPLDYSDEIIEEMSNKWIQIENAYYELKYCLDNNIVQTSTKDFDFESFKKDCIDILNEFIFFLENDLNLSNALMSFFKFIDRINFLFANDRGNIEVFDLSFNFLEKFMFILGLKVSHVSSEEKEIIQNLIEKRNGYRKNKNYVESDKIRKDVLTKFGIELIDHKNFTSWKKVR